MIGGGLQLHRYLNKRNNMDVLLLVTCRGKERLSSLTACLTSIYLELSKAFEKSSLTFNYTVAVAFNEMSNDFDKMNNGNGVRQWEQLFDNIDTNFKFHAWTDTLSVPQMWIKMLERYHRHTLFVSIDDDMLWHNMDLLDILLRKVFASGTSRTRGDFASYGVWDISNQRGYDDWMPGLKDLDYHKAVKKYGERTIWNQRPLKIQRKGRLYEYSKDTVLNCAGSVVCVSSFLKETELIDKFRQWKKGERGYDTYLCNVWKGRRFHMIGPYVDHTGVYAPHIDGTTWTGYENPSLTITNTGKHKNES